MTSEPTHSDLQQLNAEADTVEAAIQAAVRDTLIEHKRAGLPIVQWRDGRVEWVPAEAIVVEGLTGGVDAKS